MTGFPMSVCRRTVELALDSDSSDFSTTFGRLSTYAFDLHFYYILNQIIFSESRGGA